LIISPYAKRWDVRYGVLWGIFKILFKLLIDYSVVDSTKFTDWLGGLHELFLDVRCGSTIFQYMQS
jgi:hypothetical protein